MLSYTDEQRMLFDTARGMAEDEFAADAFTWQGERPVENVELLMDRGFFGINFDPEYGGGGMTELEALLLIEAIGRVCPDTARTIHTQHFVAPHSIHRLGTHEAKEKYLRPLLEDGEFVCFAVSEPQAGSDVNAMDTSVSEEDGGLVLNGEKMWVSGGGEAEAAVVWARFPEGLGSVVVDMDAPGVDVFREDVNMSDHRQAQIRFDDVEIPEIDVLSRGKREFVEQVKALNWERISAGAMSNAKALCALDRSLEYAQHRVQFDQPIADFQGIEWKLADMATKIETSRALTHVTTARGLEREDGVPDRLHSSMVKLQAARMVDDVVDQALQIHGANGYERGHPIEQLYRIGRRWRIAGGTDEIQKNGIASVLKDDGLDALY
ncbi:acyl-CoA dehydrogenase family protein [Haloplanus pelagicus]|jgi:alkylation response protein AidB-like acyl-CoA dehydrogenase|uniref:acyl-CoA dehydrogenase family protein n=1 Tax=Haloplanus pelagicus TaxID=2949995 RepID=UPI00203DE0B4|nr:acyl-CoA dehydrogenase family protein [Haloplanus sp. HW8-1]